MTTELNLNTVKLMMLIFEIKKCVQIVYTLIITVLGSSFSKYSSVKEGGQLFTDGLGYIRQCHPTWSISMASWVYTIYIFCFIFQLSESFAANMAAIEANCKSLEERFKKIPKKWSSFVTVFTFDGEVRWTEVLYLKLNI